MEKIKLKLLLGKVFTLSLLQLISINNVTASESQNLFDVLPDEVKVNILKNISSKNLVQNTRVNKDWYNLIRGNQYNNGQTKYGPEEATGNGITNNHSYERFYLNFYTNESIGVTTTNQYKQQKMDNKNKHLKDKWPLEKKLVKFHLIILI